MNILVSACLVGINCRYDGKNCLEKQLQKLTDKHTLIPVCPEQLGGLGTPRNPVELSTYDNKILAKTKDGTDLTSHFTCGAKATLRIAQLNHCKTAILKSKSPSCGHGEIYSGSFDDTLIKGNGITAQTLIEKGIEIYTEEEIPQMLRMLKVYNK